MNDELKIGQLYRYKGNDIFLVGIWRVLDLKDYDVSMSDLWDKVRIKISKATFLNYFELFSPREDLKIRWKTKYLGVVDE